MRYVPGRMQDTKKGIKKGRPGRQGTCYRLNQKHPPYCFFLPFMVLLFIIINIFVMIKIVVGREVIIIVLCKSKKKF